MTHRVTALIAATFALSACGGQIEFPADAAWPGATRMPWASQARFAITDNKSDTLSFVSADAQKPMRFGSVVVGDIPVELEGPHHIAASQDGRYLYVNLSNYVPGSGSGPHGSHGTGTEPGSLLKLDAATGAKLGECPVAANPGDVILSADDSTAFVSHFDTVLVANVTNQPGHKEEDAYASVHLVDTASMTTLGVAPKVCATPHGVALSADQRTLYVACSDADELVELDVGNPAKPAVKKRVKVGPLPGTLSSPSYFPYALSVSPKDGTVWVSDNTSHDVRVYDPKTGAMDPSRVISLGNGVGVAMFGAFTKAGDKFYVPHQGDDRVTRIDTSDVTLTADLVLPPGDGGCLNAHAFVLAPDEQSAVVVCEGDHTKAGSVVSISVPAFAATGAVTVGVFPDGAAWVPPSS